MDLWDLLGSEGDIIEVVPHRPEWAELFAQERDAILAACAGVVLRVEHIGSTAVPGLSAKPVLDLMPGVKASSDGAKAVEPMRTIGYECLGEYGIPGRLYFQKFREGRRVAHAHLFEIDSLPWRRHLLFRDLLRNDAGAAQAYERLKRTLAERFRNDRHAYTDGKAGFIEWLLARAR